jgi:hypothetical protein
MLPRREVPHHCLQQALVDLRDAFDRFCAGQSDYPRPHGTYNQQSFRFPRCEANHDRGVRRWDMGQAPPGQVPRRSQPASRSVAPLDRGQGQIHHGLARGGSVPRFILVEQDLAARRRPYGSKVGSVRVPMMRSDEAVPYVPVPTKRQDERNHRLQRGLSRKQRGSKKRAKRRRTLARHAAAIAPPQGCVASGHDQTRLRTL